MQPAYISPFSLRADTLDIAIIVVIIRLAHCKCKSFL